MTLLADTGSYRIFQKNKFDFAEKLTGDPSLNPRPCSLFCHLRQWRRGLVWPRFLRRPRTGTFGARNVAKAEFGRAIQRFSAPAGAETVAESRRNVARRNIASQRRPPAPARGQTWKRGKKLSMSSFSASESRTPSFCEAAAFFWRWSKY